MLDHYFITKDALNYLRHFVSQNHPDCIHFLEKLNKISSRKQLSYSQWWQLLEELHHLLALPALGVQIGKTVKVIDCGVLGYLFKTSQTVGEAFQCFHRYQGIIYAGSEAQLKKLNDDLLCLFWEPIHGYSSQMSDALLLAAMVNIINELIHPDRLNLHTVCFTQDIPNSELSLYQDFFRCRIKANQVRLELVFSKHDLGINIPYADAGLHTLLGQQAQVLLDSLPKQDAFLVSLAETLSKSLHRGICDAKSMAKQLTISERTLHRRLQEKNTTYKDMLVEVRKSLAKTYLSDPKLSLTDIALLLAYSEQSTFTRAFKQWFGEPPLSYRKRISSY